MDREPRRTFNLVRNIMNIKKMFRSRNKRKKKDPYNPDEPSYLLMLVVEPSLFDKIFSFLDYKTIASLELTCTVLRDVVVETKIYRKRCQHQGLLGQESLPEAGSSYDESVQQNIHYKNKLFEYFYRKKKDSLRVHYLKTSWHSPDCASCMMIETGEKTSQPGLRCDSCGRFPRSIGGYWLGKWQWRRYELKENRASFI